MKQSFTIPGVPVGKGRPRFTRNGRPYTPDKTKEYEEAIRRSWVQQNCTGFGGGIPVHVAIDAWFPIPKSVSRKKAACMVGQYHLKRPDSDNIAKAVLDALNGLAYPDDAAVQLDHCRKRYTTNEPRVDIKLWIEEEPL